MSSKKVSDPADYCFVNANSEERLSQFERLTFVGGEELTRAMSRVGKQMTSMPIENSLGPIDPQEVIAAAKFYDQPHWRKDPASFFVPPSEFLQVEEVPIHGLADGIIVDLKFPSQYVPHHPKIKDSLSKNDSNNTVHVRWWRHNEHARATIVALHGWTMGDQRTISLSFLPGAFYRLGLDVALIELPHHGRRRRRDEDGGPSVLFPSGDIALTNESLGQTISDLRTLKRYLAQRGYETVGCIGMSLGAYAGALWSALDPLDFVISAVPLVSLAQVACQVIKSSGKQDELQKAGITKQLLEKAYHVHNPLVHEQKMSPERLIIIAGIGDHIVPIKQPKLLWEHWGKPALHWFQGGHGVPLTRSEAFLEIERFLKRVGRVL